MSSKLNNSALDSAAATAAATAASLAAAKALMDKTIALVGKDISYIQADIHEIKESIKTLNDKDELYVLKEDFVFWRNLLITSMLGTIFISVLVKMFVR